MLTPAQVRTLKWFHAGATAWISATARAAGKRSAYLVGVPDCDRVTLSMIESLEEAGWINSRPRADDWEWFFSDARAAGGWKPRPLPWLAAVSA